MESRVAFETVPFRTEAEQRSAVEPVVNHLSAGGILVYPTETVYGFGCLLEDAGLSRLSAAKRRTQDKPFLILVADPAAVDGVQWTVAARTLADAFWPGALTLALRAEAGAFPAAVVGRSGTVAVRVTAHSGMRTILKALGAPITSTSANAPGEPPATEVTQAGSAILATGADGPFLLLDGGSLPASAPSTIVDCSTEPPRIIRVGAIRVAQLAECIHGIDTSGF